MKLTGRTKWGIATVAIPVLLIAAFYLYPHLPYREENPPPETGEVRDVPPSWFDRALSSYYEKKSDEPIVAIIRQDIEAQVGAISPDGQYIATGGSVIRDMAIASVTENRIVKKFAIRSGNVSAVAYSPDGRYLATGRGFTAHLRHNESVNIWDVQSGTLIRNLPGPAGPEMIENHVNTLVFSPDSRTLAVSYFPQPNKGDSVHLFDIASGERILVFHPSRAAAGTLTFLLEGKFLGYEDLGGNYNVHEINTGKRVQQFGKPGVYALSPDGQYLAAGTREEKLLKIMDRQTGREIKVLGAAKGYFRLLAFSPDGQYLAVYSDDGLSIWDVSAGKVVRELKGQPDIMSNLIGFDPEGKYFAAVCNRYVVVWDFKKLIETGRAN
jgi:WD40 repeat protein